MAFVWLSNFHYLPYRKGFCTAKICEFKTTGTLPFFCFSLSRLYFSRRILTFVLWLISIAKENCVKMYESTLKSNLTSTSTGGRHVFHSPCHWYEHTIVLALSLAIVAVCNCPCYSCFKYNDILFSQQCLSLAVLLQSDRTYYRTLSSHLGVSEGKLGALDRCVCS